MGTPKKDDETTQPNGEAGADAGAAAPEGGADTSAEAQDTSADTADKEPEGDPDPPAETETPVDTTEKEPCGHPLDYHPTFNEMGECKRKQDREREAEAGAR